MNIHEYQAKELLRKEGVPIPPGEVASTPAEEKVFKVFQDVDGRQHVSVDSLRASLPARNAA